MSTSPAQLSAQLGLQHNPPTPFGEGPLFVQGIICLYELGLEVRLDLKEGENFASRDFELEGAVYTLVVEKETDGYTVTANTGDGRYKRSFFPFQRRGTSWDTSPE